MDMTIQAAQKSPKDHSNKWVKPQNEELKKLEDSNTDSSERQEIEFNSKAQRAQGGKGPPFPINLCTRVSKIHQQSPSPREEGEEQEEGRKRAPRRRKWRHLVAWLQGQVSWLPSSLF